MKNILLLNLFIISVFAVSAKDFIITYECIDSTRKLSASVWIGEGNAKYYWETIPEELSGSGVISDQNWSYTFNDIPTGKKIRLKIESKNLYMFRIVWFMQFSSFDIEQWGSAEWRSTSSMFRSNINLNISATDTPNFSNNQSMNSMFMNCTKLESINNIHTWNTNRVKDMAMLFMNCNNFNQSINSWKTDSVKTFEMMFQNTKKFNQNLDSWNTSQVTNFEKMFENAHIFNGRIGTWNPKKAITFEKMFNHAYAFNQPIGNWNTENAVTFEEMFSHAHVFNQPIGDWNKGVGG